MLECNRNAKRKTTQLMRYLAVFLAVIGVVVLLSQTAFAKNTYLINDGNRVLIHSTYATDPEQILNEAGLPLGKDDIYTTHNGPVMPEITVQRKQLVTVIYGDRALEISTYGETVETLLKRLGLILTPSEVVSLPLSTPTYNGMVVTISRAIETEETYTTTLPYSVTYCYDASLEEGEQVILTPGVDGQLLCTAKVYCLDGKEINRVVTSEIVTRQPVNAVIALGTHVEQPTPAPMPNDPEASAPGNSIPTPDGMPVIGNGVITTPEGDLLKYTKKLDVVATAYSCNGEPGYTYSGTPARVGAIAVDPSFIPLGTRMYIVSNDGEYIYGIATAEDIGGSVKGNIIDLYFNTFDECWAFGMRECTVYLLG